MSDVHDPLWTAIADHIKALGIRAQATHGHSDFAEILPGCQSGSDVQSLDGLDALIIHKGLVEQVHPALMSTAVEQLLPTFANEVFIVLTRTGEPLSPEHEHMQAWGNIVLYAHKLDEAEAPLAFASVVPPLSRGVRMSACYVGNGRVLLETAFGHLMYVDGADNAIVPHLIRDGLFDRSVTILVGSLLDEGMCFIDVGANFGTYTLIGAQQVGENGRVIAVEPSPSIAASLDANVEVNGFKDKTNVLRCALGAREENVTLYEFSGHRGSNTLLEAIADDASENDHEEIVAREVECRRLDDIVAEYALERIDLIKIDVEGFEQEVIEGARETLRRFRPRLILEWHRGFFKRRPGTAEALYQMLTEDLGYSLRKIENDGKSFRVNFSQLMGFTHSDILAEPIDEEGK